MTDDIQFSFELFVEARKFPPGSHWRSAIHFNTDTKEGSVVVPEVAIVEVVQDPRHIYHSIDPDTGEEKPAVQVEYNGHIFFMETGTLEPLTPLH